MFRAFSPLIVGAGSIQIPAHNAGHLQDRWMHGEQQPQNPSGNVRIPENDAPKRTTKITNLWLFDFAADLAAVAVAYFVTFSLRFHSTWGIRAFDWITQFLGLVPRGDIGETYESFYVASALRIIVLLTLTLCAMYALRDLYPGRRFIKPRRVAWNVIVANATALALFYIYFYLRRNTFHPRSFFMSLLLVNVFLCPIFRTLMAKALHNIRRRWRIDTWRTILLGSDAEADFLWRLVDTVHPHGIEIVGRLEWNEGVPFHAFLQTVRESVARNQADMIVSAEKEMSVAQIMELLELAGDCRIPLKVLSHQLDIVVNQAGIEADIIHGLPLVHYPAPSPNAWRRRVRRAVDLAAAAPASLALLPLAALIGAAIKLTSRGPVFFIQERIGVDRTPFRMFKFRTMRIGADEQQAVMEEMNESADGLFKIRHDPRVTPIGKLLRHTSLDELPQLINVLRGEMTLVGPRPLPRRDFENYYETWHYSRHEGLPGLTCLWQISGRSDLGFHHMCILDVYYLRNQSLILDIQILLRTVLVVLFGRGAY
jgi:exopolysaccharide biosynthesis polyprenyl glycosylphosphotransferase